jgi:hypothetical protein
MDSNGNGETFQASGIVDRRLMQRIAEAEINKDGAVVWLEILAGFRWGKDIAFACEPYI